MVTRRARRGGEDPSQPGQLHNDRLWLRHAVGVRAMPFVRNAKWAKQTASQKTAAVGVLMWACNLASPSCQSSECVTASGVQRPETKTPSNGPNIPAKMKLNKGSRTWSAIDALQGASASVAFVDKGNLVIRALSHVCPMNQVETMGNTCLAHVVKCSKTGCSPTVRLVDILHDCS